MKKIISLLMSLLMCFSLSTTANAQTVLTNIVQPYYEQAANVKSDLSVTGTTATCISRVNGLSGVIKITINQYLQKQGFLWIWSTYDGAEWSKTEYTDSLSAVITKSSLTTGKYRLKSVFTLTNKDGETETITVYSGEVTIS